MKTDPYSSNKPSHQKVILLLVLLASLSVQVTPVYGTSYLTAPFRGAAWLAKQVYDGLSVSKEALRRLEHGTSEFRQALGKAGTSGYVWRYDDEVLQKTNPSLDHPHFKRLPEGKYLVLGVSDELDPNQLSLIDPRLAALAPEISSEVEGVIVLQKRLYDHRPIDPNDTIPLPMEIPRLLDEAQQLSRNLGKPVYCATDCYWGKAEALKAMHDPESKLLIIDPENKYAPLFKTHKQASHITPDDFFRNQHSFFEAPLPRYLPIQMNAEINGPAKLRRFMNGKTVPFEPNSIPITSSKLGGKAALVLDIDETLTPPSSLFSDEPSIGETLSNGRYQYFRESMIEQAKRPEFSMILLNSAADPKRADRIAQALSKLIPDKPICVSGGCIAETKAAINEHTLAPNVPRVVIGNSVLGDGPMLQRPNNVSHQLSIAIQNPKERRWKQQDGLEIIPSKNLEKQLPEVVNRFFEQLGTHSP